MDSCPTCQRRKTPRNVKSSQLHLVVVNNKFEQVQIDLYSGLPISCGFSAIMVVTDALTKYVVIAPIKDKTATCVVQAFWEHFVCYFSFPTKVQTDRGKEFTSHFANEFFRIASDKL